jgi:cyclophilin family peptidyl-prolyl cis-trans isomerase
MPSRSRDKQLAKQAAARRAARDSVQRRRRITSGVVGALAGLLAIAIGFWVLTGGDDGTSSASPTPSPSVTTTPSSTPSGSTEPQKVGEVTTVAQPPADVACDGVQPESFREPHPQFDRAPTPKEVLKKNTLYTAVMQTSCGEIRIKLTSAKTPDTVASFVFLAQQGYFDGMIFHRVVDSIDVIQGGDPLGEGTGGPGYSIPDELSGQETYVPGTLAMANAGADTGGSQFFIITGPEGTNLDAVPNYTIFGKVVSGLEAAQAINALMATTDGTFDGAPTEAAYILTVTIETEKIPEGSPSDAG